MLVANLLPWKEKNFRRNRCVLYMIFLMLIVMEGVFFVFFNHILLDKNTKLLVLIARAEQAQRAVPLAAITARTQVLHKMIALSQLNRKKTERDTDVIKAIAVIANVLPDQMVLTSFSWQDGKMDLRGEGAVIASIAYYQHALQQHFYDKKVQLLDIQKTNASLALQFHLEII